MGGKYDTYFFQTAGADNSAIRKELKAANYSTVGGFVHQEPEKISFQAKVSFLPTVIKYNIKSLVMPGTGNRAGNIHNAGGMAMALPNARNQYLKTQIETASREQLVVMLFDGIIRFTEQARKAIQEKQIEDSHHSLMRAQAIIMELMCTIDKEKGGDVATNLMSLHAYAFNCLIKCNMQKDATFIDEVQKIYRQLRDAWVTAMDNADVSSTKSPAEQGAPQATPPVAAAASQQGLMASAAPAPAAAKVGAYGMGRTAMMAGGMSTPAAAPADTPAAPQPKANAMLNAYGANSRITA